MLARAFETFKSESERPTLIIVDSHIAYGAPTKQGTAAAHGEPLGVEEVKLTKKAYGWPEDAQFLVPDGVREHFAANLGERGRVLREAWMEHFGRYQEEHPDLADQLLRMQRRELPDGGTRRSPSSRPTRRGWRRASPRVRS
jgi:transketolase